MSFDVRSMAAQIMRENKIDALHNERIGCGCDLDDLVPCKRSIDEIAECTPSYERICPSCGSKIYITAQGFSVTEELGATVAVAE